jgi:hypothetical protein
VYRNDSGWSFFRWEYFDARTSRCIYMYRAA